MMHYLYSKKPFIGVFRSLLLPRISSVNLNASDVTHVWRDNHGESYAISETYTESPLELSSFLLIRTRERLAI
jgi:hypothetical protein